MSGVKVRRRRRRRRRRDKKREISGSWWRKKGEGRRRAGGRGDRGSRRPKEAGPEVWEPARHQRHCPVGLLKHLTRVLLGNGGSAPLASAPACTGTHAPVASPHWPRHHLHGAALREPPQRQRTPDCFKVPGRRNNKKCGREMALKNM